MRIQISKRAQAQLHQIYIYYKDSGKGMAGRRIRAAILKKIMRLKIFPEMGQEEELLKEKNKGFRYLVEGKYKIVYRVKEDTVRIELIFDTRQDPSKM